MPQLFMKFSVYLSQSPCQGRGRGRVHIPLRRWAHTGEDPQGYQSTPPPFQTGKPPPPPPRLCNVKSEFPTNRIHSFCQQACHSHPPLPSAPPPRQKSSVDETLPCPSPSLHAPALLCKHGYRLRRGIVP